MAHSTREGAAAPRAAPPVSPARTLVVGESVDGTALAIAREPWVGRLPDGSPDVHLTLLLARPPRAGERDVGELVERGRLVLALGFGLDKSGLDAAREELGEEVEPLFVRGGAVDLVDLTSDRPLTSAPVRGSLAAARLEAVLDGASALAVVDALVGRASGLGLRARLVFRPADGGEQKNTVEIEEALEDVLGGVVVGRSLDEVATLLAEGADGTANPVPPSRVNRVRRRTERAAQSEEGVPVALAEGRLRAIEAALAAGQPSLARPFVLGGPASVVLGDLVIDPTAAPRPLPIIEAAEAPLWRDRVRANEYWYAPTFELVRPDPARPAETGPFRFVFERTGVTAAGAPALTGDVLFTLRPVMRAETRAELDARGDPTARSVPRDGLGAVLEIPFVDDRDGSLKRHAFPADVEDEGDAIRASVRLLNEWVRLAYGALAEPGFQAEPPRLRIAYSFSAYVPVREQDASVVLGGKAIVTPVGAGDGAAGVPHLRPSDLVYELASGARLAFRRETRASARRRLPDDEPLRPILAAAIRPPKVAEPVLTVKPLPITAAALEELRERVEYAERSVVRTDQQDATVPCDGFGAFYLERRNGGEHAVGCRDALLLGATIYRRFEELADLRSDRYRVFRSLQQPGRFVLLPAVYRIGRHEPGDGADAYRPTVLLYALLSADSAVASRVVLDAALQPDVLPAEVRRLRDRLLQHSPDPRIELPSEIAVDEVRVSWVLPSGLTSSTRTAMLPDGSIRATFETDIVDWQILRAMLERGGVSGAGEFVLGDGTTLTTALELGLRAIAGPRTAGAVSVTLAGRSARVRNEIEQPLDVADLDAYGPFGQRTVRVEAALAPDGEREVELPEGTTEAYAVYRRPDGAVTLEEVRSFVEDIETNVVFVNLVDLAGRGLAALDVEAQLVGVATTKHARLDPDADIASLEFVLPLTTWLEQHVVEFRLTAEPIGGQPTTGAWTRWDVARNGNVIGLQSAHLP